MNILAGPIQSMIWPYTFISLYMGDATIIIIFVRLGYKNEKKSYFFNCI